ncbi:DUF4153 domain-containing protein [Phaeobacter inhibens]|uniref:DUF4153 domain-containing protein n=1 Tax=Phaeobacter inhibens TaxID=221822 RepID=UPI0021A2DD6D|nr:DUF4153 domain-containing protein [Phaeobacter inhibens]UWR61586.1 DUF4153 domain-containing protein [Phaeobacter inhibens]
MTDPDTATALRARLPMVALGAGSGFALWLLARDWDQPGLSESLFLAMFAFLSSFCGASLAMIGPLSLLRALQGGLWVAVPMTALMLLAALRYPAATDLLQNEVLVLMALTLGAMACPFVLLRLSVPDRWTRFAALSAASWGIAFRLACGVGFVAVFWILGLLSNALLDLVNVTILEDIAEVDWLALTLSGAVFGLGLAVVQELGGGGAPHLLFRLLSLLLIPVLLVVGLFLAAIPLQGLSSAFGHLSSAATLMAMSAVMMTLVCVALTRQEQPKGANGIAARLLAIGLMLVTGLAVWAVLMRVWQYGWTPDRIYALLFAMMLLLHGLVYAGCAAIGGAHWPDLLRRAIVGLALMTGATLALALTPLVDAGRIAGNNQVARVLAGETKAEELPLWQMAHDWGQGGLDALARLDAHAEETGDKDLSKRLQSARSAATRWQMTTDVVDVTDDQRKELIELLPVRPAGALVTADDFRGLKRYQLLRWIRGCKQLLPDGNAGCVLIRGALGATSDETADFALLFFREGRDGAQLESLALRFGPDGADMLGRVILERGTPVEEWATEQVEAALAAAQADRFEISPARQNTLKLGGLEVLVRP